MNSSEGFWPLQTTYIILKGPSQKSSQLIVCDGAFNCVFKHSLIFKSPEYLKDPTDVKLKKSQTLNLPFVSIGRTVQNQNTVTEGRATDGFRHLAPINYFRNNQISKQL